MNFDYKVVKFTLKFNSRSFILKSALVNIGYLNHLSACKNLKQKLVEVLRGRRTLDSALSV